MSTNEPPGHPNTSCVPLGTDCIAHDMPMLCPHRCEHGVARDNAYGTTCGCDDLTDREIARTKAVAP